jgi:signal transduction histidine kinase
MMIEEAAAPSDWDVALNSASASCDLLIFEQRDVTDAATPSVYSLTSAHRDLVVVVLVPAPRSRCESSLLQAGAFDVVDDGSELDSQLAHTMAAARRVVALQEERARLTSELAHQDKLSALGVLAAGVSHEINNPCAAILSNIVVIRDQLQALVERPRFQRIEALDSIIGEWAESLGDCIAATNRIQSIVKTLNVFSRKSDTASPIRVELNDEIRTVLRLIGKEVRFQAHFDVLLAPGMPAILAPPNCLTQVLTNLLVNALQALEKTEHPLISITTDFDDTHVLLEIVDNGPGMSPDVLSRIFDPFFTTKPIGRGTGLGLAITRQLVEKMGGEIFVESEPGHGAKFTVVLERKLALIEGARAERGFGPPQYDRLRVLLIDDDELTLRSMQRSLAPHFECTSLARAELALATLREDSEFDVIVADVVMPDMNGLDFFVQVAATHPELSARTLFISGGITSEALRARVSDTGRPCLAKPVDVQELIRTIRRVGRPFEELGR